MQVKQVITALAVAFGASVAVATSHGELLEHNGVAMRYQQLGKGIFVGVPADEWDESVHAASTDEWDVQGLEEEHHEHHNGTHHHPGHDGRGISLETRNLADTCQAVGEKILFGLQWTLLAGINTWITVARAYSNGDIGNFLNRPFVANAGGVAIAGTISGAILYAVNQSAKSCSTSNDSIDALGSAVNAVLGPNPTAQCITVVVSGNSGSFTTTFAAGPDNTSPAAAC